MVGRLDCSPKRDRYRDNCSYVQVVAIVGAAARLRWGLGEARIGVLEIVGTVTAT